MQGCKQIIYTKERPVTKHASHSTNDGERHHAALHGYHDTVQYSGPQTEHHKTWGCYNNLPAWKTAHHALQAGMTATSLARLTVTERDIRGEELHESGGTNRLSVANYEDEGVPGQFQAQDSR